MYQVWTKEEYDERWQKVDCETQEEVRRAIWEALKAGREPLLTQEVSYEASIKIREGEVPPAKSKAKAKGRVEEEKTEEATGASEADTPGKGQDTGD